MIIQAARTTASATESGGPPRASPASVYRPVELTTLEWPSQRTASPVPPIVAPRILRILFRRTIAMYQDIRRSLLSGVSQESLLWRTLKYWYRPASWVIGTTYRATSRRFSEPPIVLGGAPRSGTTLLLSVLSAHPRIHAIPHETSAFTPPERPTGAQSGKDFELYRVFAPLALSRPEEGCTRWCEKTPSNISSFGAILAHFGSAIRLIHIVRDGRDATTSRHLRRPAEYYYGPSKWAQIVADGLRFRDHPQVLLVRYEDLVLDFVTTVDGTVQAHP